MVPHGTMPIQAEAECTSVAEVCRWTPEREGCKGVVGETRAVAGGVALGGVGGGGGERQPVARGAL